MKNLIITLDKEKMYIILIIITQKVKIIIIGISLPEAMKIKGYMFLLLIAKKRKKMLKGKIFKQKL